MHTKAGSGSQGLERLVRILPPLALVVLLALAVLLLAARSANATQQAQPAIRLALEDEGEFEDGELESGELEEEVCEAAEEEFEEGELDEAEMEAVCEEATDEVQQTGKASGSPRSARCPLRSAHAHAVTLAGGRRLKLTIGYTTYRPAGATIEVSHGRTRIGTFRRHLGRSGVVRIVRRLGDGPAPRRIVVRLRIAQGKCAGARAQRVRIRQGNR
jgi:hypothetical protein